MILKSIFHTYPWLKKIMQTKEFGLLIFFGFLFGMIIIRLLRLQIITGDDYQIMLSDQHFRESKLDAERGNIYVTDKSKKNIKLTENITLYNVFVDPEFVKDKVKFISVIAPIIYFHLCRQYGFIEPTKETCIKNIEGFTRIKLLPSDPSFFYYMSGVVSDNYTTFDRSGYNTSYKKVFTDFTQDFAIDLIKQRLQLAIKRGYKEANYLGFFENPSFLQAIEKLPYIKRQDNNYIYIQYSLVVGQTSKAKKELTTILKKFGYDGYLPYLDHALERQRYRYLKLISNANPVIAKTINKIKAQYYYERSVDNVPLLHGLGLESIPKRYYPFGTFMANIIGYMDNQGEPHKGIEEYGDQLWLKGTPGEIQGRSSAWIGDVGSNDFNIQQPIHGKNVYLTIDPSIQTEVEKITQDYQKFLKADSISVLVYDPFSGHIKASTTYPTFDPNDPQAAFQLEPLDPTKRQYIDDQTYVDVPIYIMTGGVMKLATPDEKYNTLIPKYISKNVYGAGVFVDKNISYPYDPGSVFKVITYAIGLDTKEITKYDYYDDPNNFVEIDQYTITNANKACQGTHNFLYALQYSCNVGLVKIVQKVTKHIFYNYLEKLGFGHTTNIELAGEDQGYVESSSTVAKSRFLNNAFGLGILATPLQMAVAYGTIINSGELLKPTIIDKICDPNTNICYTNKSQKIRQIFAPTITDLVATSLVEVTKTKENAPYVSISGYSLGGKSGTAAIVYKGKYMQGNGWTNTSFIGIVTQKNLKYIIVVQVRRPRIDQWGSSTAGKVFREVASFLIGYEMLEE